MESLMNLTDETVVAVRNLAVVLRDSQVGLTDASAKVSDKAVVRLLYRLAVERANMGEELNDFLRVNEELPSPNMAWVSELRDVSAQIRAAVNAGDPDVVLTEVERSEAMIVAQYKKLLPKIIDSPLNDVLLEQFEKVTNGHDAIRELRDSRKH